MSVKLTAIIESENVIYFHDGKWKTAPDDLGEYWGFEMVEEIKFERLMDGVKPPEGLYKINITVEKIAD